ncbi:MAG: TatD family hydrolase [Burkholderiaceae bacterium]
MLIDSHIHLDAAEFDTDRAAVIDRASVAGVGGYVIPAVAPFNFDVVRTLAHSLPHAVYALGIHPMYVMPLEVDEALEQLDAALAQHASDPRLVAVGEIGLDYYVPGLDAAKQEQFYVAQLKLARKHGLPVILHVRRSQDMLLKWLRVIDVPGGIAHAFNGSDDQAARFVARGFALGFGGAATFNGSGRIRHLAASLPATAIALETDAPDIAPQWLHHDGMIERNTPEQLLRIAAQIAGLRDIDVGELTSAATANVCRVLPRAAAVFHA